jgi:protein O-GlcNAc transferase
MSDISGLREASLARELHGRGQAAAAEQHYRVALAAQPGDLALRRDFAVLLMQARREAEAVSLIEEPGIVEYADADLLSVLALCLRATGANERALDVAQRINTLDANSALGWLLRGSLQVRLGDARGAEAPLRRCIAIEPGMAEAWHHLGDSLQLQRRWDEAIAAYQVAARRQPICQELAGRIGLAAQGYEAAQRLMPERADVLARLAQAQAMQCLHEAEVRTSNRLGAVLSGPLAADDAPEPFILAFLDIDAKAKAAALRHHAQRIQRSVARLPEARRPAKTSDVLRIGYVSADFGSHAVGQLVRSHFAAHDRSRFHVTGYSLRTHQGEVADAIRRGFDAFVDCEASGDSAVAQAIRSNGTDVLVDMAGFTHGARPRILAMRPAPLQLGWLGFIHGHQAPWLDALLLDEHVLPGDGDWPYEDRIVRLPGTLLPGSPMHQGRRDRARFGLPEGVPLLASFNSSYKLDAALIGAWCRILERAPTTHLVVHLPQHARAGFVQRWSASGGPQDRLILVDSVSFKEQSDRAASCDLMLDAFRYQGGATTMHAVGNGLPVLTLASGTAPTARLGVSVNCFLEMADLVCDDVESYIDRAAALANDLSHLRQVSERLRRQVVVRGLFDPARATRAIEQVVADWLS